MTEESVIMHPMQGAALVMWDLTTCPLPTEVAQCFGIVRNLRSAAFAHTSCTRVSVFGMGGAPPGPILNILYQKMMLILTVPKVHVQKMIGDMRKFAKFNPAPASYLVISGDKALSSTLNMLHGRNYNILVAHPDGHPHLAETASCVWTFPGILRGEPPYLVRKEMVPRMCSFTIPQPKVGTFVLWDTRSCPLPADVSTCHDMLDNIYSVVYANCSTCTQITMTAVGLAKGSIPSSTISFLYLDMLLVFTNPDIHVSRMIHAMEHWAKSNSVPANFLVISGDAALSSALENLRSRKYNILVAHPDEHSADVIATASRVWHFEDLVSGKAPYFVRPEVVPPRRVDKEPSELPIAARVRSKKKKKKIYHQATEIAKGQAL